MWMVFFSFEYIITNGSDENKTICIVSTVKSSNNEVLGVSVDSVDVSAATQQFCVTFAVEGVEYSEDT